MQALAAGRKQQILSMMHQLNYQLTMLTQKRMNLLQTNMIVSDGKVTQQEMQEAGHYVQEGVSGCIGIGQQMDTAWRSGGYTGVNLVRPDASNPADLVIHDAARDRMIQQIDLKEREIDGQAKQIESRLSAYQKEYEAVMKQEEFAAKIDTPRYVA